MRNKVFSYAWIAACALSALPLAAGAAVPARDDYPSRPLRFIVPFPSGGSTDIIARFISQRLTESLGKPVVIDNRPGAAGLLGAEIIAKSPPDGYSIMIHSASLTTSVAVQPKVSFDMLKDFTPITNLVETPLLMTVHPSVPAKTLQELLALARAKPGALNYGSAGVGGVIQFAMEMLNRMAKTDLVHVPFKGGTPAIAAILGGQIHILMMPMLDVQPQVKIGKLRALAVSSSTRSRFMPDIPTISDSGVPGYAASQWWGLFAPAGLPQAITLRLNQEVGKIMRSQEMRDRLAVDAAEPAPSTPEAFAKHLRNELETWRRVAREAGIKPE
ncbi:MAG: tripartite tricarboxylate transporter substrate binding protein [Burkholderiales bacterium]|nr:tripartite tricarboxylate transporter substrate binding protein [Burkholderiales bacterium]